MQDRTALRVAMGPNRLHTALPAPHHTRGSSDCRRGLLRHSVRTPPRAKDRSSISNQAGSRSRILRHLLRRHRATCGTVGNVWPFLSVTESMRMRRRVAVVSLAVAFVACGSEAPAPPAAPPDDTVSHEPGLPPAGSRPQRVEPRDGLVDVRPVPWDRHRIRDGGNAVDLFFWSGVESCYGVDRVEVRYAATTVELTILQGRDPAAEVCIELAVRKVIGVDLDEPVAGREVVDGVPEG